MYRPELPFIPMDPERELRASELEEQKIKRDFTTPIPMFYINCLDCRRPVTHYEHPGSQSVSFLVSKIDRTAFRGLKEQY